MNDAFTAVLNAIEAGLDLGDHAYTGASVMTATPQWHEGCCKYGVYRCQDGWHGVPACKTCRVEWPCPTAQRMAGVQ